MKKAVTSILHSLSQNAPRLNHRWLLAHIFLFMLFIGFLPVSYAAQSFTPEFGDLITEKFSWTQFPELSGVDVQCFAQDSAGQLWFGHARGITRYDGLNWRHDDAANGLPPTFIRRLLTSHSGKIYALYETDGLYALQDTVWHHISLFPKDSTTYYWDMTLAGQDTLWLSTNLGPVLLSDSLKILLGSNGEKRPLDDARAHQSSATTWNINSIYQDKNDNLWLVDVTDADPTFVLIPEWPKNVHSSAQWKKYETGFPGRSVGSFPYIYQDKKGRYWIYTYNELSGLYSFQHPDSSWHYYDLAALGSDNLVISVLETRDDRLWFGGNGFLNAFQDGQFHIYSPNDLNVQISPIHLMQARDGALWLLSVNIQVHRIDYNGNNWNVLNNLHFQCETADGIECYLEKSGTVVFHDVKNSRWTSYGSGDGLMNMPNVVLCTDDGDIWAAGSENGIAAVSHFDGSSWKTDTFANLSWSTSYQAAMAHADGSVWFGAMGDAADSFQGGCIVYRKQDDSYQSRHLVFEPPAYNRVAQLTQTVTGQIWAGGSQLLYFDDNKFMLVQNQNDLQRGWIDCILGASDSSLWVAKGGVGIFQLKNKEWTKYTTQDALPDNLVANVLELPNGDILASTTSGLTRFDGRSWSPVFLPRELTLARESGTLRATRDGSIWMNKAPRTWYFRAQRAEPRPLTLEFRCIKYTPDSQPPETKITFFQEKMSSPANQFIAWQALDRWNATSHGEFTFSYKLDDAPWSPFTPMQSTQFLDMKPGRHLFQLKSKDRAGNVDSSPAQINFTVLPPIWQQPWFISMIILFLSTILGLLVALGINNKRLSHANQEISHVSAFKEHFYLNVSHELRTPLTMIIASLSQLAAQTGNTVSNIKDQLSVMKQHSHYLLRLVNQLLDFRKIETGRYPIHVQEGNLGEFIQQIKKRFDPFARQHAINLTLKITDVKTGWFDPNNLETILVNLVGNALKYTPDSGDISISVKGIRQNFVPASKTRRNIGSSVVIKNCQWICIKVADTGIGIPEDRLPHIFDRFYHVEHPGRLYYDSIGIGLDLTKEIVELNHGTIDVESQEGHGSLFTVNLPIDRRCFAASESEPLVNSNVTPRVDMARMDEILEERQRLLATPAQMPTDPAWSDSNPKAPVLLIVEDHPDLRHLLFSFLKDSYRVLQAGDGQKGLELARDTIPDLIISDIMMPKMDGVELTRILKNDINTSHIPVILLTVKHETANRVLGFEIGADDYLSKPFEYKELKVRIENLIKNRKKLQDRFSKEIHVKPTDITITSLDAGFLEKCIRVVEDHIDEAEFNVDVFCKRIGMSRTRAYQKVKSISGFPPKEFITHIKLKRAAQYLVDSDRNVGEIAYILHFSDHAHLSRLFKKAFGVSPTEYRRQKNHHKED